MQLVKVTGSAIPAEVASVKSAGGKVEETARMVAQFLATSTEGDGASFLIPQGEKVSSVQRTVARALNSMVKGESSYKIPPTVDVPANNNNGTPAWDFRVSRVDGGALALYFVPHFKPQEEETPAETPAETPEPVHVPS